MTSVFLTHTLEFYDMVSTLIQIKDEKPDAKLKVMVGIAFSPTDAKAPVYDYWMGMSHGE